MGREGQCGRAGLSDAVRRKGRTSTNSDNAKIGSCFTGPDRSLHSEMPIPAGAPESVAEEYRALRLLILRHCGSDSPSADALPLGTFDP